MNVRFRLLAPLALAFAAACSGSDTTVPTAPPAPSKPLPEASAFVAQNCSAEQVAALISEVLPRQQATLLTLIVNQLRLQATNGQRDRAQATALVLVDRLLKARAAGQTSADPAKVKRLETLIKLILCVADLPQTAIDLSASGGAAVVTPTSPPTTITTGDRLAGVVVPTGAVQVTTLVTVTPSPTGFGPLLTDLDQYPLFYEFSASPSVAQFNQKVTVGVCTQGDVAAIFPRLRLAHNIGTQIGDVEILPRVDAPFLDCTNADLILGARTMPKSSLYAGWKRLQRFAEPLLASVFLPQPAYASSMVLRGCCLGGLAGSFSPFGAVDTASIVLEASGSTAFGGAPGSVVTPSVIAKKAAFAKANPGQPARGIDVTFAAISGNGSVTPTTVRTGPSGLASTSWTIVAGPTSITAGAVNGRASTAGGTTSVVPGAPVTFTATTASPFSFGATDWRSLSPTVTGYDPAWSSLSFDDSGWTLGAAPFGMENPPDTYCSVYSPNLAVSKTFTPGSTLILRRVFAAPAFASSALLTLGVDNDVKIYVNGQQQLTALGPNGETLTAGEDGFFQHEGCPSNQDFRVALSGLSAGGNTLVLIVRDRGGSTYFDAGVSTTP